ncbi:vacuolar protein sorting-associated protein 45 [Nematocida sp. AWRm80]|nr:vacuolar protein sorting-associated protein 45 [Nematocida sp. AWRm80]
MDALLGDIQGALSRGDGIKALLLDEFTKQAISPLFSHSQLLEYDFFLFDMLERERQSIFVCCVAILSRSSIPLLIKEVSAPKYKSYHIFITGEITQQEIAEIANKDLWGTVVELQELYLCGVLFDRNLFILSGTSDSECARSLGWFLNGIGAVPSIRYIFGSEVAYKTALSVERAIDTSLECNTDFLILERSFDLLTPLQYPWTYQGMAAEYLEYKAGVLSWGCHSLVLPETDRFFQETKFKDILYASEYLKESLQKVKAAREIVSEFIATIKQKAQDSEQLILHLKAIAEISKVCIANDKVSETIADIIENNFTEIHTLTSDAYTQEQQLRILLVYYLCQEAIPVHTPLGMFWRETKKLSLIPQQYSEKISLFTETYLQGTVERKRPKYLKNTSRKLGYIPVLTSLVDKLKSNGLSTKEYPCINYSPGQKKRLVVFISGGITLLEHRSLSLLFQEKYPGQQCILLSDKVITGTELINGLLNRNDHLDKSPE